MELHYYPDIEVEALVYGLCSGNISHEVRCVPNYNIDGEIYVGPISTLKEKNRIILDSGNVFSNFIGPAFYFNEEANFVNIKENDVLSDFYARMFLKKEVRHGNSIPLMINHHAEFLNLSLKEISSNNKVEIFGMWSQLSQGLPLPLYVATINDEFENRKEYFENLIKKSIKFLHENTDMIVKEVAGTMDIRRLNLEKMAVLNFVNKSSYIMGNEEYEAIQTILKYL